MMKTKKIPMRTCVITREKLPKQELIRVVRTPEGNVIIDTTSKANGRGAYLKKDKEVFEKAQKSKTLDKVLEIEVPDSIFDELMNTIK
ncbi:MAG: YlxR family protein [Bacilli bacterium]|nr:YlxR family protein [Bacilli bacterium]